MTFYDFTVRLLLSLLLGSIIGLERQITGHPAGIRTNVLVCLGATMFVLYPFCIGSEDVTRTAAQIISGVGFLGSGIIFKEGANVRGINTAATLWCTAAIGVLSGAGQHIYALTAACILVAGNMLLRPVSRRIGILSLFEETEYTYKISATCHENQEFSIRAILMHTIPSKHFYLINLESSDIIGDKVEIQATFLCTGKKGDDIAEKIVRSIGVNEGIYTTGWERLD